MSFHEDVARDNRKTFLNPREFARARCVGGREILCDLYEASPATNSDEMGLSAATYRLFAATDDLPPLRIGDDLQIDDQLWNIIAYREDGGMTNVTLTRIS